MKKIASIIFFALALICLVSCGKNKPATTELTRDGIWEEMDKLKSISPEGIDKVDYLFLTEGGAMGNTLDNKDEIKDVYELITAVSLGDPTESAVEDDGLVVTLSVGDDSISFSFEHDILVENNNDRYLVSNLGPLKKYLQDMLPEEK